MFALYAYVQTFHILNVETKEVKTVNPIDTVRHLDTTIVSCPTLICLSFASQWNACVKSSLLLPLDLLLR